MDDSERDASVDTSIDPSAVAPGRWRRLRKWLLALTVCLAIGALMVPPLASRWIKSELIAHFATEGLDMEIGSLSVSLTGSLDVRDLVVRDGAEMLARCDSISSSVVLTSLLGDAPNAHATVTGSTVLGERTADGFRLPIVERLERLARVADAMDDRTTHAWHVGFDVIDATIVIRSAGELEVFARMNVSGDLDGIPEFSEFLAADGTPGESSSRLRARGSIQYPLKVAGRELPEFIKLVNAAGDESIEFDVDGVVRAGSILRLLAGFEGQGTTTIPAMEMDGIQLAGPFAFRLEQGKLIGGGDLVVNGGKAPVHAELDLSDGPASRSKIRVEFDRVKIDRGLTNHLRHVHPILSLTRSAVDAAVDGSLEGLLVGNVEFTHDGPLDLSNLLGGWETFPKDQLLGSGRIEVNGFTVDGSQILDTVLDWLDIDDPESIALNPIQFTVRDGRLAYDGPMKLEIDGIATYWRGSIGLDQSIDMVWELPITSAMIKREPALRFVPGGKIGLPVSGTVDSPALDFRGAVTQLVANSARGGVTELGGNLVGDLLNGDEALGAKELLRQADRLYDDGKLGEARELYAKIRAEHQNTLTYQLNKKRIKKRARP